VLALLTVQMARLETGSALAGCTMQAFRPK
jgi:hypothetical protein